MSRAFGRVLEQYARKYKLLLCEQVRYQTPHKNFIRFDGVLKDDVGIDFGYWEAKAKAVNLKAEINKKFKKGYPKSNILFEDGIKAILYQNSLPVLEVEMKNAEDLKVLLQKFFDYETPELSNFKQAAADFKKNVPVIADNLREMIIQQAKENQVFTQKRKVFLNICQAAINPDIKLGEVDEMLIQHILTKQIFIWQKY